MRKCIGEGQLSNKLRIVAGECELTYVCVTFDVIVYSLLI